MKNTTREEAQQVLMDTLGVQQQMLIEENSTLPERLIDCMVKFAEMQVKNHGVIDHVMEKTPNICTDTGKECKHDCSGLCKERC